MADTKFEKTPTTTSSMPLTRKRDQQPRCNCDAEKLKEVLDFGIVLATIYGAFNLFRFISDKVLTSPRLISCLIAWLAYKFPSTQQAADWVSLVRASVAGVLTYVFLSPQILLTLRNSFSINSMVRHVGETLTAMASNEAPDDLKDADTAATTTAMPLVETKAETATTILPVWALSILGMGSLGTTIYLLAENILGE